ncbi:INO80 complex subunit B-like conserved region domain-containing protein [Plasmodiophora brassicae]|nr:hypothetical protein PBRA_008810 [Plasmodiophora brassicae]
MAAGSRGIRVRLRRRPDSDFEVVATAYDFVDVRPGPPLVVVVRRHHADADEAYESQDSSALMEVDDDDEDEVDQEDRQPTRLTSRQRSMRFGRPDEDEEDDMDDGDDNVSTPAIALSEEAALKKSEQQRRRKLALDRQEEQEKQETIERLLKKTSTRKAKSDRFKSRHEGKVRLSAVKRRAQERSIAHPGVIRFRTYIVGDDRIESTVTFPDDVDVQPPTSAAPDPIPIRPTSFCACGNQRRYTCPSTLRPVCSLACYKRLHDQPAFAATS